MHVLLIYTCIHVHILSSPLISSVIIHVLCSYLKVENATIEDIKAATHDLIGEFKSQYDKLSVFAKFGEDAFLSVFKSLRDASDPVEALTDAVNLADNLRSDIDR